MYYPTIFISNQEFRSSDNDSYDTKIVNGIHLKYRKELKKDLIIIDSEKVFLFAHVNVAYRGKIKKLSDNIEKLYSEFSVSIESFHWGFLFLYNFDDDSFKCYNDPFGIYPLFINRKDTFFNLSNDFDELVNGFNDVSFNKNAIHDYFLFNYTLKSRTIFNEINQFEGGSIFSGKNEEFKIRKSFSLGNYIFQKNNSGIDEMKERLAKHITSNIDENKKTKIPLTGGFDTKVILSLALENKLNFDSYTFGTPLSNDTKAARKISDQLGIKNTFYNSYEYFENKIEEDLLGFLRAAPNAPIIQTLLQYKMMNNEIQNTNLITGKMGGELIVGPILLSQLITTKAAAVITKSKKVNLKKELNSIISDIGIINEDNFNEHSEEYISLIDSYNDGNEENKKVIEFLLNETYAKFFGTVFCNVFASSNMINPFIDLHFLNMLFNSKYSITNKRVFSNAPLGHFKSRRFYPKIIQKSHPEILKSAMDRGYNLEDFLHWYKYPKPILNYVKRKVQGKKTTPELNYMSLLNNKLYKLTKDSALFELNIINQSRLDELILQLKNNNISSFHYQKLIQLFVLDLLAKKYAQKIKCK
ncbi:MAG: hypothetical protein DBW72_04100 [Flavobacteriales bacterium]|nr:MAG: hypothetical protein DBW72_04100 [Flavobacteriales bacterium]